MTFFKSQCPPRRINGSKTLVSATKRALPCIRRLSASSGLAFAGLAAKELPSAVNRRLGDHFCDDDNSEFLLSWIGGLLGRGLLFTRRLNRFPVGVREFGVAEADDHFVQRAGKLERHFVIFAHGGCQCLRRSRASRPLRCETGWCAGYNHWIFQLQQS
jgi:hypothetical protein